ncbi:hypothetical protein DITRI_Ditri09bG0130500 [Diplodiscus trichospermus]
MEVIREGMESDGDLSKDSISDEDIAYRNDVILREANAVWHLGSELGLDFATRKNNMLDIFSTLERWLWGNAGYKSITADAVGRSGGLLTGWDEEFFILENQIVSNRFILIIGSIKSLNLRCGFGNGYAPNDDNERAQFWEELSCSLGSLEIPWCLGWDFNVVRNHGEKTGVTFNTSAMTAFFNFIEELGLVDLPLLGGKFTRSNNREIESCSRWSRLPIYFFIVISLGKFGHIGYLVEG